MTAQFSLIINLHAIQVLVSNLAQEEGNLLKPGVVYEFSSPYDSSDAARTMLDVLEQAKINNHSDSINQQTESQIL